METKMETKDFALALESLFDGSMSDGFNFDVKHMEWTDEGVLAVTTKDDTRFQIVVSKVVCAWCPTFDPKDEANKGATHGMCPTCKEKMEAGSR
jgi:Zn finger protein HypA/HybF involved in hydrogenase expression